MLIRFKKYGFQGGELLFRVFLPFNIKAKADYYIKGDEVDESSMGFIGTVISL